jgi:hypothetical protein
MMTKPKDSEIKDAIKRLTIEYVLQCCRDHRRPWQEVGK